MVFSVSGHKGANTDLPWRLSATLKLGQIDGHIVAGKCPFRKADQSCLLMKVVQRHPQHIAFGFNEDLLKVFFTHGQ